MLDLSNNNSGRIDFRRAYRAGGQRRVYLKASEGVNFVDKRYKDWYTQARRAGLKVGAYHFGHPSNSPEAEATIFHRVVGKLRPGDLRPCLDFEWGTPSAAWAVRFLNAAEHLFGVRPIIYSYPDFLRRAGFKKAPAALWLASYGRNDGKEHAFIIPKPWTKVCAHQYTSNGHMAGVGLVDISHVFNGRALDVPRFSLSRIAS